MAAAESTPDGKLPQLVKLIDALIAPVILIIAVLGSILGGLATPTEAASIGAVGAIMLAGYRLDKRRGWQITLAAVCLPALLLVTASYDLRMQRDHISTLQWNAIYLALILTFGLAAGVAIALMRTYKNRTDAGQRILTGVMRSTLEITSMVFVILIGASMFSLVFRGFGGDDMIARLLQTLPGGTAMALIVVMGVMFILGFFLDFLEIVFIVVPIVAPVLLQMEIVEGELMNPVWLGIMMAVVLQTSFLTPPFGFALFYLRGVAPDSITTTAIYKGVIPFVIMQLMVLLVLWHMPGLATWLPEMLYAS
jgi:TRAP-type mannitol/chloroaromatic compound transport system permease large subunit